jgi:uncharacterized protein
MIVVYVFILTAVVKSDKYYEEALSILENEESIDYNNLISLLETSANLGNPDAFSKLGELFLVGYTDSNGQISRDYKLAYSYFKKGSELGSVDSRFFIHVMYKEFLLTNEFDDVINYVSFSDIRSNMIRAMDGTSYLFILAHVNSVLECRRLEHLSPPEFLNKTINDQMDTVINFPFLVPQECKITRDLVYLLMAQAHKSIDYIQKTGKIPYNFKRIDLELDYLYGTDSQNALSLFTKTIETYSNPVGYTNIGETHMFGNNLNGIPRNMPEGLKYYEKAIEMGDHNAAAALGTVYSQGIGVKSNSTKALEYLNKAISKGSIKAMVTLGLMHRTGNGVEKNITKAFEYTKMAADKGDIDSISNLAVFYLNGEGVPKDVQKALDYIQIAADHGLLPGKFNLGLMYFDGLGVESSYEKALELFMSVIYESQKDNYLSKAYKSFRTGDIKGAYISYLIASNLGYQSAISSLGYMHYKGLGSNKCKIDKEYCAAFYYYQSIALYNDPWAYEKLAKVLYSGGSSFKPDYDKAYQFYLSAPATGEVLFNLGYMSEQGLGCSVDNDKAIEYYDKIIANAGDNGIDVEAAYPARLAKYKLIIKMKLLSVLSILLYF